MSVRKFPEPESMRRGITGTCKWCGKATVKKPAIYWHPECFTEYALHTRLDSQVSFVIRRDGEKCGSCGCSAIKWKRGDSYGQNWSRDQLWHGMPREHLWPPCRKHWRNRTTDDRLIGLVCPVWPTSGLELDHRIPLWSVVDLPDDERRPYFGPTNLWLLCPACHKAKTKSEAAERAALRRAGAAQLSMRL